MSVHAPNHNNMNNMQHANGTNDALSTMAAGMYATLPSGAQAPLATSSSSIAAPMRITRRLNVRIQGSLSDFAQDGQGGATWRVMEGKQSAIWGIQELLGHCLSGTAGTTGNGIADATTHASATNILATAMIKEVHLLEHKSTFKVPLGVVINCLPAHEMTAAGEAFCYTVLPESVNTVPLRLFQASEDCEESLRWKQEYPKYNAENLEKEGVLPFSNSSYYFVHENHPAITLLRANKDLLRTDIDAQKKIDHEW